MDVDWKIWSDVSQTELWRAVALSLGYDPFDLPGYHQQIEHAPFDNCPAEFQRRLFIARSHLGSGLKANVRPDMPLWCAHVELAVLHQWANTLKNPWDFPERFPQAIPQVVCPPAQPEPLEKQLTTAENGKEEEAVDKRNMRWFRVWEEEGGYDVRGAQSAAIKRIVESEGVTRSNAKSGIQRGQKLVVEMRREGRARPTPQALSKTDPFGWGNNRSS
jgi:hypothetical protein